MRAEIKFRISEEHARSIFDFSEGKAISERLRLVALSADDPRLAALARLYAQHAGRGFYGWNVERKYSKSETERASLHLLEIQTGVLPTGEECGTVYDDSDVCPLCGAARVQVSPLRLRISNTPRRAEIAQTWGGETIVSSRLVRLLIEAGITGWGLGAVQRSKKAEEEPFALSETQSGKRLLQAASQAGIQYPSPDFYVWINGPERRKAFLRAVREHESTKLPGRRLPGGTSADWYQLFVTSKPVELSPSTRFGLNPFDGDIHEQYRCPLGLRDHVIGLNLLSQVTVQGTVGDGMDFLRSCGLVGRRVGLFNPRPLLFISARLRDLLLKNAIKGWASEVVNLSPDSSTQSSSAPN
jgi:hypothetical protein